jgi:apolipoprotein N-acyltransferase
MVQNGADLLVNITNDAWFGRTGAPYQHFSMAAIRAVENRRALVRAANTGISGFVDPVGRVLATTPLFKEKALKQKIPILKTKTIYSRYGDFFAIACLVAALVGLIQRYRSKLRFRQ